MSKADKYVKRGIAFLEGDVTSKDYEQAFYWLSKAHELGSEEAEAAIREMEAKSLGTPYSGEQPVDVYGSDAAMRQQAAAQAMSEAGACPPNPNRCIACGMEALTWSTSNDGAKHCSTELGGCGTTLMIPIEEEGLVRGLAMQPYRESIPGRNETAYSSLGSLIHMVKYDSRVDDDMKAGMISEIARRMAECGVIEQLARDAKRDLVVVPAPSSKRRNVQPVRLLAQFISEGGYRFADVLTKRSSIESKSRPSGTELAPGDIRCNDDMSGRTILLVDDTYGEGATLRACIRALNDAGARDIYFLTVCKNIFGGMKGSVTDDDDLH